MALIERLMAFETPRVPVHYFSSMLGELERGFVTTQQVVDAFNLDASAQAELTALVAKLKPLPESYAIGAFVTLTNVGAAYDTIGAAKGLGFVGLDITGITRLELRVQYNKIGTGTLSWQLWNQTDGSEVGVSDDAAAAGDNKTATIVVTPAQPLAGGVKLLRVRVKSTTAADDPVYYGSTLFIRRAATLTADTLHLVLMQAEKNIAPLNTAAALRTRLGI